MNRDQTISFRTTRWEAKLIQSKAAKGRMSMSEYIRKAALDKPIVHIEGIDKVVPALNRIGNNINQLTVILRTRNIQQIGFEETKDEFGKLVLLINEALDKGHRNGDYQDGERKVG